MTVFWGIYMATNISDLLHDVIIQAAETKDAQRELAERETRFINGLALSGNPLNVSGEVVIGNVIVRRPYSHMPLVVAEIANVAPETVVTQ